MIRKLTRENTVTEDDMRVLLKAGVTRQQIEDAWFAADRIVLFLVDCDDFKLIDDVHGYAVDNEVF